MLDLRILETYWAFIIPGIAFRLPFGIFLMRGFFRGLPPELGDAARTDGANEWRVFRQVFLPLSWPGMATLIVFQFIWTWNQFAMPLIYVQRDELRPISLGTMFFFGQFTSDRGMIAAGVTIAMIPVDHPLPAAATPLHRGDHGGGAEELGAVSRLRNQRY